MTALSPPDQLFAWRREDHTRKGGSSLLRWTYRGLSSLTRYTLITDRAAILALPPEEPIHSSREEALAFLRANHPAPDPRLTFILSDLEYSPNPSEIVVLDEPLYCGPDSISDVQSLLLRFPSLWMRDNSFLKTLSPPIHVTTKRLLGRFTRVINSPTVSKRVATLRRNKADILSDLRSGGPILPPSAFTRFPSVLHCGDPHIPLTPSGRIFDDGRTSHLSSLLSHLEDINRLQREGRPARRKLNSLLTQDLLLLLVSFLPHIPSLTSFPPSPYTQLHDFLTSPIQPWWVSSSNQLDIRRRRYDRTSHRYIHHHPNPLIDTLDVDDRASYTEPSTTKGARLVALISSTLRLLLRRRKTTLFRCRLLLSPPPTA